MKCNYYSNHKIKESHQFDVKFQWILFYKLNFVTWCKSQMAWLDLLIHFFVTFVFHINLVLTRTKK